MTTSRSLVRLGYALSAIVVIGAAASDIEAEPTRPLSRRALAGLEPLQVGQAFLRLGERVGIVLRTDDRDTSYQLPGGVAAPDTARTLEALEALTASNPHYRLDRGPKGVLRLTPKQYGRCAAYLQESVGSLSMEAPIFDVLVTILGQRNADVPEAPTTVLGHDDTFRQRVEYVFTGGALADALDTLVLSATGVGWLVAEHPPEPQIGRSEPYCTTTLFSGSTITSGF